MDRRDYRANFKELVLLIMGHRLHFKVEGDSMLPFLKTGDHVLVKTNHPQAGSIVVAKDEGLLLIKKLVQVKSGLAELKSINPKGVNLNVPEDQLIGELKAIF